MTVSSQLYETTVKNFPFNPTREQSDLLHALCAFYTSSQDHPLFLLQGYAGTGKTTLLSAFVNALSAMRRKKVLLAPTGRAAKVFSNRSGHPAYTIHKKIYRKEKVAGGGIRLGLAPNLHTNTLFLIDEASMIGSYSLKSDGTIQSRNLLEDVIEFVYNGKNCRLIFIGDRGQLPPVGADFSPALQQSYLENHFPRLNIRRFELSEVLRQAYDSAILENATALRSAPEHSFPHIKLRQNSDLKRIDGSELEDVLDSSFSNYGDTNTIMITRSNKRANLFNEQVRARIFWYEEQVVANDLLMVVRNNYYWLGEDVSSNFIANGETIRVKRILGRTSLYGFDFVDARVELIDFPDYGEFEVKIMLDALSENQPSISRERMKELFFAIEEDYAFERNKKKRYERIMSDPYFNALQVKYAYAVTCHKSQGGQWDCVFIDQGYLTEEMLDQSYFRWLYTAFTRATEQLYLVNFHPAFFENEPSLD
ncbi:MAG: ATP-dependent DNA helicase [Bacteroidota bacterium]